MFVDVQMAYGQMLLIIFAMPAMFCILDVAIILAQGFIPVTIHLYALHATLDIMDLPKYPYQGGVVILHVVPVLWDVQVVQAQLLALIVLGQH
jgi:hypothetical protein